MEAGRMNLGIRNKTAFISGGSHGIGLASALLLANEGCNIIICSRNVDRLKYASEQIANKKVNCFCVQGDVLSDCDRIISETKNIEIDILVNNVGGGGRWGSSNVLETSIETWKEVFEKNVWTSLRFTNAFLPKMIEKRWGRIIWITSIYGVEAGGRPWFNIAKVSQTMMMKNLSTNIDFVRNGITFNAVAPGDIMISETGWDTEKNNPNFHNILNEYPMGRLGTVEEVAAAVAFLSSDLSSYVNGTSIRVDGGRSKGI